MTRTECFESVRRQQGNFNKGVAAWITQTCGKPVEEGTLRCKYHNTINRKAIERAKARSEWLNEHRDATARQRALKKKAKDA